MAVDQSIVFVLGVVDTVSKAVLGFLHRNRVVGADLGTCIQQFFDQDQRRSFAHIIRIGLERESPHAEGLALEISVKMRMDLIEEYFFLQFIDFFH